MLNSNTFYKSFTGVDALAFLMLPEAKPILLGSLTTLSHSVYREKKPVPLLGKINTGGFTRGMRSIAGTMVFTLINQHLVEDILTQIPYLQEHGKMKADELPFFDIMVICANEYGAASQMMLYGVEFFEDGQVLSVQDIYIENTFSFVARDIDDFAKIDVIVSSGSSSASTASSTADAVVGYDYTTAGYNESYVSTASMQNKDLVQAQTKLNELGYNVNINGVLDNVTLGSLTSYQKENKLNSTGYLDTTTYDLLLNSVTGSVIEVTNKNGAYVYNSIDKNTILGIAKYESTYIGTAVTGFAEIKFYDVTGYIEIANTSLATKILKYTYDDVTPNAVVNIVSLADFDAKQIGTNLTANKDSQVRITAISYYANGRVATNSRYSDLTANVEKKLLLSYIPDAYIYNIASGSMPYMVEFIVAPNNEETLRKWIVKIKG